MHGITIELQMSLLLFVALAGYLLASKIGQPAVIGQLLLGLLVGNSGLGLITYTGFVANIAQLGAIILLFVIGLEFKLKDIAKLQYVWIAIFGVVFPWAGGYWIATLFGFDTNKAVLIGVALTATSIAITADTLRELGQLGSNTAKAIIGAAVIDDILALLALSMAEQLSEGSIAWSTTGILLFKAGIFLVLGFLIGHFVLSKVVVRLDESEIARKYPDFVFVFALMMAFFYAIAAALMGLSAIVGAFVAGVVLEGVQLKYSKHFKEGTEYLRIIFGAIFFISLGVLADIRALTPEMISFSLLLTLVAIATKVVGCGLPAKLQGFSWRESLVVGFGMAPRGEIAMAIALISLQKGIIEQPAYVSLMFMSILSTLCVPLVLKNWLYKDASG